MLCRVGNAVTCQKHVARTNLNSNFIRTLESPGHVEGRRMWIWIHGHNPVTNDWLSWSQEGVVVESTTVTRVDSLVSWLHRWDVHWVESQPWGARLIAYHWVESQLESWIKIHLVKPELEIVWFLSYRKTHTNLLLQSRCKLHTHIKKDFLAVTSSVGFRWSVWFLK